MSRSDTIVALSSGGLPSGVAVIRISGAECCRVVTSLIGKTLKPRRAQLVPIKSPVDGAVIDEGLALWFPGPHSFTGEDCLELQVHGSRAVVSELLEILGEFQNVRLADAGEFSRRAFENGKMDLTEIEGLADLIESETKQQRIQAFNQQQGSLRALYEGWRSELIRLRAFIEAELDFSEEEDVPDDISKAGFVKLEKLIEEIASHLNDNRAGEIIRDGFKIVLLGKPNAGKSSLLNHLSKRDVAIVTNEPGTTRDILSVDLDLEGFAVTISDTAGLRDSDNLIEQEGIRRANLAAENADLVIWLKELDENGDDDIPDIRNLILLHSKDDDGKLKGDSVSVITGHGIDTLLINIVDRIKAATQVSDSGLLSRQRYRENLAEALVYLQNANDSANADRELQSEELRHASDLIGKITGVIDVEDLLDVIFSEFCVGK